jgi:hypothetical protein
MSKKRKNKSMLEKEYVEAFLMLCDVGVIHEKLQKKVEQLSAALNDKPPIIGSIGPGIKVEKGKPVKDKPVAMLEELVDRIFELHTLTIYPCSDLIESCEMYLKHVRKKTTVIKKIHIQEEWDMIKSSRTPTFGHSSRTPTLGRASFVIPNER